MIKEFRDFLMRGNLVELAVAFVMGLAFAALITSFVDNLVMPIVAMIIGKPDFSDLTFTINDAVFGYGAFITSAITFIATAGTADGHPVYAGGTIIRFSQRIRLAQCFRFADVDVQTPETPGRLRLRLDV